MQLRGRKHVATVGGAVAVALLAACSSSSSSSSSSTGATSAPATTSSAAAAAASGTLNGAGSTFQLTFQQAAISAYKSVASGVTVNYDGVGSGSGRADLYAGTVNYAGSDSTIPSTEQAKLNGKKVLYFPVLIGPIDVAYNLQGVSNLKLTPTLISQIFQAKITTWNDPAIKAVNPGVSLPSTPITLAVRSDSSGTTQNFTLFLQDAVGSAWALGSSSTVKWPSTAHAASGNGGVATIIKSTAGAIGYVDYSTAQASGLTAASVENKAGKFVAPSTTAASAAAAGVTIKPRPHLPRCLGVNRPDRLPDHLPVVGHRVRGAAERDRRLAAQGLPRLPARAAGPGAARTAALRTAAVQHRLDGHRAAEPDHLVT